MRTIWKYDLPVGDAITIEMPQGAKVLSVQVQYGHPRVWALVNPDAPKELRRFVLAGTGHDMPDEADKLEHIGTFQLHAGQLVFHLFGADGAA